MILLETVLINQLGQVVYRFKPNGTTQLLDLGHLSDGIYQYTIFYENTLAAKGKVVKIP